MARPLAEAIDAARVFFNDGMPFEALHPTTCRVLLGERIAIIGPSGSGKSTLLNLLGGLDGPTSGRVSWPELGNIDELRPELVSVVPQMPSLIPWLTVLDNVALPALLGPRPEAAREQAMASLECIDLMGLQKKLPQELSGGQAQRVAVARALVGGCKLILADEPTGQLDGATTNSLLDALLSHLATRDTALVIATHDPIVARRMGRTWTIADGRLDTADGSADAEMDD